MQSFPRSVVPLFCRSLFPLFPPFVAQFFFKFFCQNRKIPSKMDPPPFFTGGVSPKTCAIFPKKIFFRRSRLPPPPKFFFSKSQPAKKNPKKILSEVKNSSIFELPDPGQVTSVRAEVQLLPPCEGGGGATQGIQPWVRK